MAPVSAPDTAVSAAVAAPDHTDDDGPWWSLAELPNWWVRTCADGRLHARHRTRRRTRNRPGGIPDVTVAPGADQPGRLLLALCGSAEFGAAHPDLSRPT